MSESFDVVIVGGGVGGTFLAGLLGRNRKVLLIESDTHPEPLARRISVSGNGRCNFFNEDLLCEESLPKFLFPLEASFFHGGRNYARETLSFLTDEMGIRFFKEGKLYYPYFNRAECVRNPMIRAVERENVQVRNGRVVSIDRKGKTIRFSDGNPSLRYSTLVFAVGGRSYDRKDFSPSLFASLGIPYRPFSPSLCPLLIKERVPPYLVGQRLRGKVSLQLQDRLFGVEEGEILFRKDALSGIAVFQLSRVYNEAIAKGDKGIFSLVVDYSEHDGFSGLGSSPESLPSFLSRYLAESKTRPFEPLSFTISSLAPFESSQASYGGLRLDSFEWDFSLRGDPSFFAIGECLDVNFPCGGYNIGTTMVEAYVVAQRLGGLE